MRKIIWDQDQEEVERLGVNRGTEQRVVRPQFKTKGKQLPVLKNKECFPTNRSILIIFNESYSV